MDPSRWPRGILYPQKLTLISPTSDGRSVGRVRSRSKATEFFFFADESRPKFRRKISPSPSESKSLLCSAQAYFETLKLETMCSSESRVKFHHKTQHYIPEYIYIDKHEALYCPHKFSWSQHSLDLLWEGRSSLRPVRSGNYTRRHRLRVPYSDSIHSTDYYAESKRVFCRRRVEWRMRMTS
jgi:hypothetical protein